MAIGGGYREGPISCILGTIFFVFVNSWANKEGIQCLVRALDGEKKIKRIMYCAKCGKKLEENEKFCTACGRPVARKKQIENNSKK